MTDQAIPPRGETAPPLLPNNFDLLRLLAAAQVLVIHTADHFLHHRIYGIELLRQAPGVPVFFFISGFLISASWERNPDLRAYALNRFLRIVPAYVAVAVFSLLAILVFAHLPLAQDAGRLAVWFAAQFLFLSDWNPQFLRGYGSGVVNGSLWTIPVEVGFYIATPLLYWLLRKTRRETAILWTIIVVSFALAYLDLAAWHGSGPTLTKAIALTPLPWFGMFVCGLVAQRNMRFLLPIVGGRAWQFGLVTLALMVLTTFWRFPPLIVSGSRFIGIVNFAALAFFVLAAAFSQRDLALRLLRRNDISYGLYLFHLPIANILLAVGVTGALGMGLTAVLGCVAAALSWFLIEKPALGLRPKALYRHDG